MTTEQFRPPEHCRVRRDTRDFPGQAVLFDDDGTAICAFPLETPDQVIFSALDLANRAFAAGHYAGRQDKLRQINAVLKLV